MRPGKPRKIQETPDTCTFYIDIEFDKTDSDDIHDAFHYANSVYPGCEVMHKPGALVVVQRVKR